MRIRQLWFYRLLTFVLCDINTSIKSLSLSAFGSTPACVCIPGCRHWRPACAMCVCVRVHGPPSHSWDVQPYCLWSRKHLFPTINSVSICKIYYSRSRHNIQSWRLFGLPIYIESLRLKRGKNEQSNVVMFWCWILLLEKELIWIELESLDTEKLCRRQNKSFSYQTFRPKMIGGVLELLLTKDFLA